MDGFKPTILACILLLASALVGGATLSTFEGEISDSQCALNVHSLTRSHQEMLKSKSMGGDAASCSRFCVKNMGGDWVLSTKKYVYRLDNQDEAAKFAGRRVRISGTLDTKRNTLHIVKFELPQ